MEDQAAAFRETAAVEEAVAACMEDVITNNTADNIVSLNRNSSLTRLKSISGAAIRDIDVRSLLFCGRVVGLSPLCA